VASLTRQLAEYLSGVSARALPDDVAQRVKLHLLDSLAAMISGATLDAGRLAIEYVRHETQGHEASVIGGGLLTSAADAAWANGMSGHADETDDSHPAGFHPGCGIVAAALAMAEREQRPGSVLLRAIAAGYDTGSRAVLAAVPPSTRARGYAVTTHAIGGTFGAAAAAATQAGLDARRMSYVLSYAAQQAWGGRSYLRDAHHVEKAFVYGGRPARAGVMATTMVQRGFDAVADVFDGQFNYLAAVGFEADPPALVDGLGERWEIMRTNIKRYPVGSPILGVVEGLNRIQSAAYVDPADVERVELTMPGMSAQVVDERDMPNVNAQHIAALMLVDGRLGLEASHDVSRMQDPRVLTVRQKVTLSSGADGVTGVTITLREGRVVAEQVPTRRGAPQLEDVRDKALELIAPVAGDAAASQFVNLILNMEDLPDMRDVQSLLRSIRVREL
jgi:2-methylcitrate dehydratase PrpD